MLIVPGGFGVAKNLTSYAFQGKGYSVNDDVKKFILDFHKSKKPMVFMCISPIIPAKLFKNVQLTVGNDQEVKEVLELQGAQIRDCAPEDIIVDEENLIVSTPAYMQSTTISKISVGIEKAVEAAIELTKIKNAKRCIVNSFHIDSVADIKSKFMRMNYKISIIAYKSYME